MKKYSLIEKLEERTNLWFNSETNEYEIWRNHGLVEKFDYHLLTNAKKEETDKLAIEEANDWLKDTNTCNLTLKEYLRRNNIQLTQLEVDCLNEILAEGSFYEESANYIPEEKRFYVDRKHGCFIGWQIEEDDIPGCRGALSSLKKKGILDIQYSYDDIDKPLAAYYMYVTPEFEEDSYHKLKLDKSNLK